MTNFTSTRLVAISFIVLAITAAPAYTMLMLG